MKKFFLLAISLMAVCTTVNAEDADKNYIRNSIYVIKLDETSSKPDYNTAFGYMNATFDTINFASNYSNYNDFALTERHIDFAKLPAVTEADIKNFDDDSAVEKAIASALQSQGLKSGSSDAEYVAKLMKYFTDNHVANKLIAKMHNEPGTPDDQCKWDKDLKVIYELGLQGASQEAIANAKATSNLTQLAYGAENKLLANSYVCVVRYGYADAKEYIAVATAAAELAVSNLPSIAQVAARKGLELIASKIKGYFVRANAYLFQIDWNDALYNKFYQKYWDNPEGFMTDPDFKLKYIGKSSKYAPATLSMKASAQEDKLIARATVRGTDAAIAALQRDYENFRPMCSLHVIDGKLGAYIGVKEGVESGDKFDVFEAVWNEKTNTADWNKVGTIKVDKGAVWDNRSGSGVQLEGAAEDKTDKAAEGANASVTYTAFKEKPKKYGEGNMIRMAK